MKGRTLEQSATHTHRPLQHAHPILSPLPTRPPLSLIKPSWSGRRLGCLPLDNATARALQPPPIANVTSRTTPAVRGEPTLECLRTQSLSVPSHCAPLRRLSSHSLFIPSLRQRSIHRLHHTHTHTHTPLTIAPPRGPFIFSHLSPSPLNHPSLFLSSPPPSASALTRGGAARPGSSAAGGRSTCS